MNPIVHGFQMCSHAGPLCEEPMNGVGFIIEEINVDEWDSKGELKRVQPMIFSHLCSFVLTVRC
jgi:ribosome assembly protein 1